jgi:hypothetical protein
MKEVDINADEVDYLVSHQANKFMIDFIVKRLKFDTKKVPFCIEKYGNTLMSSPDLVLSHMGFFNGIDDKTNELSGVPLDMTDTAKVELLEDVMYLYDSLLPKQIEKTDHPQGTLLWQLNKGQPYYERIKESLKEKKTDRGDLSTDIDMLLNLIVGKTRTYVDIKDRNRQSLIEAYAKNKDLDESDLNKIDELTKNLMPREVVTTSFDGIYIK